MRLRGALKPLVLLCSLAVLSAAPLLLLSPAAPPARPPPARIRGLAFLLQLTNATLPGAGRLLKALWHPDNAFAVHVDARWADSPEAERLRDLVARPPYRDNVRVMRPRKLTYAGITLALNTLDAVEELLALPGGRWASFINLSGSDYPLLPPGELQDVLEAANRQAGQHLSFVAHWGRGTERWRRPALDPALWGHDRTLAKQGATWSWVQPDRPLPHGPTWVVLSRVACEAALRSAGMRRVLAALGSVEAAEESVWQMFFSWTEEGREMAGSVAGDCLRYDQPVEGESHVKWLRTREQLDRALASGALFARKFEPASALLDAIDAMSETERGKVRSRAVERISRAVRSLLLAALDGGNDTTER